MCGICGFYNLRDDDVEVEGEVLNIGSADINVSNVGTEYLQSINDMFSFNNIVNEIKGCIINRNWSLIICYIKRLDYRTLKYFKNSITGWIKMSFRARSTERTES